MLPFITIPEFNLKVLIDSGASNSIMNPQVAKNYFENYSFKKTFTIRSLSQIITNDSNISYPLLKDYGINNNVNFHVVQWHDRFDALLGSEDLRKLGAKIDYNQQNLEINNIQIPFYFELNPFNFKPLKHKAKSYVKIPVNINNGQIVVPQLELDNNVIIPELVTYARDGYCIVPIQNLSKEIDINFHHRIDVEPLTNFELSLNPGTNKEKFDVSKAIRIDHLNLEEQAEIIALCRNYHDIFYDDKCDLSFTNAIKHSIRTTDEEPVFSKSYRYPYHLKNEIQIQIQKLLDNKIIQPSISPYSSPVWIVPKKLDASGRKKWRLVIDYRKLNEKTIEDKYPLPRIDEILDNLGRCTYFSTIDLAQGFHQIEMDQNSIEKTAFSVNNGHYEYVRMPFGLKNAPSSFQRVMDNILRKYLYKNCFVYMDDVVIFSKSLQEHLNHIKLIFQELRKYNLKIQLDKSEFLRKEVAFLGHIITSEGIKPNPSKIKAVQEYPLPKSIKEIRAFLGLIGYYRRFILNFAKIVYPFTKCLKKGTKIDITNPDYLSAFQKCKELLTNAPILAYPDFQKSFVITTDASNIAVGSVLSQNSIPIAFYSRTLNSAERNYSTIERELLSIVEAVKHFRPYIYGRPFLIETDHKPLVWLFSLKDPNSRLVKWRLRLEEYDYKVQYKKGKDNVVADALSRIEINTQEKFNNNDNLDLISILPNVNNDVSLEDIDEILNNPDKNNDRLSDDNTQHTSISNPVFTIPISDKIVNLFNNRIIFKLGDEYKINCKKPFHKQTYEVTIRRGSELENLTNFLEQTINPTTLYGVYFFDKEVEPKFIKICQHLFDNNVKIIKSNILAKDLENSEDQYNAIKEYHDQNHNGINETYSNLKLKYYWPDMKIKINKIINECENCLLSKYERNPYKPQFSGPMLAKKPFDVIHIDTFSFDNNKFLTIIDLFSRYVQAYFIQDGTSITVLNKLRHYFSHHGYPKKIVCDEGKEFKNNVFQEYCSLFKIDLHFTTNYNPNSNSPIERAHSTLLEKLRVAKLHHKNETAKDMMTTIVLNYNQSIHSSTGYTPFTLLYGPFENLNAHEIDLDKIIYESYNQKRKDEILPFYEHLYQKQHNKGTKNLEKLNQSKEQVEFNEPVAYFTRQRIRKTDPTYDKVIVTSIDQNKVTGIREKTKRVANINTRKLKRTKKKFSLQTLPAEPEPGPSSPNFTNERLLPRKLRNR